MKPLMSVIVPSYNHSSYVKEAIDSVLEQNLYPQTELIVIDDGSKDDSPEFLRQYAMSKGFRLILKTNEGISATLNRGIEEANGKYLTFLASDDRMSPGRLQEQVQFMEENPEVDVAAGGVKIIDSSGTEILTKLPEKLGSLSFEDMLRNNLVFAPTAIFRKSVFQNYGKYSTGMKLEDYFMWLRILKQGGSIFNTDRIWAHYRVLTHEIKKKEISYYKGSLQVLNEHLDHPITLRLIKKKRLKFLVKLALFENVKEDNELFQEYNQTSFAQKLFIRSVHSLPDRFKRLLRTKLYGL